jgi:hypothetical protein
MQFLHVVQTLVQNSVNMKKHSMSATEVVPFKQPTCLSDQVMLIISSPKTSFYMLTGFHSSLAFFEMELDMHSVLCSFSFFKKQKFQMVLHITFSHNAALLNDIL